MQTKDLLKAIFTLTLSLGAPTFGSPNPHQFTDPVRKFDLNVADTQWDFFDAEDISSRTSKTDLELQFVGRAPHVTNKAQPTLTWRVDKGEFTSAKNYSEKWLKEFPKFGYELQMSRSAKFGNLDGYDMELNSTISNRRIRQFMVARPQEMWVFTCSAEDKEFANAWRACEKILNTARVR